jgi:hypothetical protein
MTGVLAAMPVDTASMEWANRCARFCAHLFHAAGSHIAFPVGACDVAALGDCPKAGLLAAAIDLRALLARSPEGLNALRDLGFEVSISAGSLDGSAFRVDAQGG